MEVVGDLIVFIRHPTERHTQGVLVLCCSTSSLPTLKVRVIEPEQTLVDPAPIRGNTMINIPMPDQMIPIVATRRQMVLS